MSVCYMRVSHSSMASEDPYQPDRTLRRILVLAWIDTNWLRVMRNGAWFWCRIFLYEEVERFTGEKSSQVVGSLVPHFGREENDFDILVQMFTELRKLVFVARAEEVLSVINAEDFDVGWVDGFTFKHRKDTSNGSDDDMRLFLQSLPILVDVGPTNGEVGGDKDRSSRSGD